MAAGEFRRVSFRLILVQVGLPMPAFDPALVRYSRQMLFEPIGEAGQRKLAAARVVLVGCGALGSVLADSMARAGVGSLRICDRDFVELDNLQRQTLFTEQDVADGLPKAEAARRRLGGVNSAVTIDAVVTDVNPTNIEPLVAGADLILDGADNFETRYLVNDVAVKCGIPWVYGAAVASNGLAMAIVPGDTPCLRCVFDDAPPPETSPTCDTVGVIGPLIHLVAGVQACEAVKILCGLRDAMNRHLVSIDAWSGRFVNINVQGARDRADCVCCRQGRFEFLEGNRISSAGHLCGRGAIQINRTGDRTLDLSALARKVQPVAGGPVRVNEYLLQATVEAYEITVFVDGRALIKGTDDPAVAKAVYARYVGA